MPKSAKTNVARSEDRFNMMIGRLSEVARKLKDDDPAAETILSAMHWLREYTEPWQCPDCGHNSKVPEFDHMPRLCSKCGSDRMLPYAYLEVERMNKQMRLMLQALNYYAKRRFGHVAMEALKKCNSVQLNGDWQPGAPTQSATWENKKPRNRWFTFRLFRG